METITSEMIIDLFEKYQTYCFWQSAGFSLFGGLFFVFIMSLAITGDYGQYLIPFIILAASLIFLVIGVTNAYLKAVPLKTEIAMQTEKLISENAGYEVVIMWENLKGLLLK
jgi:hypothetical protein